MLSIPESGRTKVPRIAIDVKAKFCCGIENNVVLLDKYGGTQFHRLIGIVPGGNSLCPSTNMVGTLKDCDLDRDVALIGELLNVICS